MNITGKLVVAAVTHTDTRIWTTDAHRGDKPEVIERPSAEHIHHHVRNEQQTTHFMKQIVLNIRTLKALRQLSLQLVRFC